MIWAVIPAAGRGMRFGGEVPKQYLEAAGKPLIAHALDALLSHPQIDGAMVALSTDDTRWPGWSTLHGKPLPIYGKGDNVRDWLFVDDHARALDIIVQRGQIGHTYNVGGRNERQNIDVVKTICAILDRLRPGGRPYADLITYVTDRPGHDQRYAIDASKLENELGWRANETFETGIEKTVQWYLDNEWWWRPLREKVYAGERLGLIQAAAS